MIPYCSATGTKSTIAALRAARWRLLVVATGHDKNSGLPYALDNGAWSAHVNGRPFDVEKFEKLLDWSASCPIRPDWCVLPDIVGGGLKSLDFSLTWVDTVSKYSKLNLLAVQDGMTPADVEGLVGPSVNSIRRITHCTNAGADSFDGTSVCRFPVNLNKLDRARKQLGFKL